MTAAQHITDLIHAHQLALPQFLLIDIETTGLGDACQPIEVFASTLNHKNIVQREILIRPAVDAHWEPFAENMHNSSGLKHRAVSDGLTLEDADQALAEAAWHTNQPLIVVGNSVAFDRRVVKNHLPRFDEQLHYRILDVTSLAQFRGALAPDLPAFEKTRRHTAAEDALETLQELLCYMREMRPAYADLSF